MKGRMKKQTSLFKVGDIVWSDYFGAGVVYKIIASAAHYPICVEWKDDRWLGLHYFFSSKGQYSECYTDAEKDIKLVRRIRNRGGCRK